MQCRNRWQKRRWSGSPTPRLLLKLEFFFCMYTETHDLCTTVFAGYFGFDWKTGYVRLRIHNSPIVCSCIHVNRTLQQSLKTFSISPLEGVMERRSAGSRVANVGVCSRLTEQNAHNIRPIIDCREMKWSQTWEIIQSFRVGCLTGRR